ncbi:uncharacterized protein LOC106398491 [Brassica napus]|uniref:uncharacterized protein LOC106398491 n=1 Tax=Brassica napus TaxID=3708 RepID=UPI0020785247|nr:uncharacterized protein LOC106398491 [Brassica napus]
MNFPASVYNNVPLLTFTIVEIPSRGRTHLSKKLDRVLCNEEWLECFPESIAVFGKPGISDHSPCCTFLDQLKPPQKRPFRFFSHLNHHPDFHNLVGAVWNSLPILGSKQLCVSKKLKEMKAFIRTFNKENFSEIEKRVQEAFDHLTDCQHASLSAPTSLTAAAEKSAHDKWYTLAKAEDKFLRQRTRVQLSVDGDAGNYFQNPLGGVNTPTTSSPPDIASIMQVKCSAEAVTSLAALFSDLDIEKAFLSLPMNKSPGPDDYPAEFFTGNWRVVGRDMIAAVKEFLSTGELLQQWNAILLILVPKKVNANKITEFRPIACCNTVYKVASKLLANRLKDHLSTLISTSQSAFVPGRLLVENVLLATELVSGYNWKKITKRCMLKVDFQKAFDTLDWDFVLYTLEALEFPLIFRNLIKKCLTTTRFSVAINGEPCGYFKGTIGLRQSDPLSPYLFVLALEVFTQQLKRKYIDGSIGFHPQHFLSQADSVRCIADTMEEFDLWSGLRMNKSKTELYTAGLNNAETLEISRLGKLRLTDYRPLIDRISSNFNTWSAKALSFAGRRQLLSSVIYGSINFWTTAFILPKNCIKKVESMCSQFLWGGTETKKSIAKVAWKTVTLPKSEGGLGLRDICRWNKTLYLKLIWRLFTTKVKEYRIKGENLWAMDVTKCISSSWHSLLSLQGLAARFLKAKMGNGQQLSFWYDQWTPLGPLINRFGTVGPRELQIFVLASVAQACNNDGWLLRGARSPAAEELYTYLTTIPLPSLSTIDNTFVWKIDGNESQQFSTSKTWSMVRNRSLEQRWTQNIWFKGHIPTHAFTAWVAHQNRLPTRSRLVDWGMNIPSPCCCLCSIEIGSTDHLFLQCEITKRGFHTWTAFSEWMGIRDWVVSLTLKRAVAQATISSLWTERNKRLHDGVSQTPAIIFKRIDRIIRDAI